MADGNLIVHGRLIIGAEAAAMSLSDAAGAGHVVSRCPRCSHRESADIRGWLASGYDRALPLSAFRRRLRCLCGSREVVLEVWPLAPAAGEDTARTFFWR